MRCYNQTYLLTAFQIHQAIRPRTTHGTSALKTSSTTSDNQSRDGSALSERLRLIGHVAPAWNQGHENRGSIISKSRAAVSDQWGLPPVAPGLMSRLHNEQKPVAAARMSEGIPTQ